MITLPNMGQFYYTQGRRPSRPQQFFEESRLLLTTHQRHECFVLEHMKIAWRFHIMRSAVQVMDTKDSDTDEAHANVALLGGGRNVAVGGWRQIAEIGDAPGWTRSR